MSAEILLTKLGLWTLADLDGLPDDGRRYEIIDGSLLVSPPPSNDHQLLAETALVRDEQRVDIVEPLRLSLTPSQLRG